MRSGNRALWVTIIGESASILRYVNFSWRNMHALGALIFLEFFEEWSQTCRKHSL